MKVFISWSGEMSHKVALALRDWLPSVIQTIEPYVSSEDIDKGARWSSDIAAELEKSAFGILCVTRQNLEAPWIHFEAGALSKSVDKSRVSPLLFGLKRSEVKSGPLLQFQSTLAEAEDLRKLILSLNATSQPPLLEEQRLNTIFDVWWPQLEKRLNGLLAEANAAAGPPEGVVRKPAAGTEILEEILELTRQQHRILNSPSDLLPPKYMTELMRLTTEIPRNHPVFRDLSRRWSEVQMELKLLSEQENVPKKLIVEILDRLETPIDYIIDSELGPVDVCDYRNSCPTTARLRKEHALQCCALTGRSTPTRCGKELHGAVGSRAPSGPLPLRDGHTPVRGYERTACVSHNVLASHRRQSSRNGRAWMTTSGTHFGACSLCSTGVSTRLREVAPTAAQIMCGDRICIP